MCVSIFVACRCADYALRSHTPSWLDDAPRLHTCNCGVAIPDHSFREIKLRVVDAVVARLRHGVDDGFAVFLVLQSQRQMPVKTNDLHFRLSSVVANRARIVQDASARESNFVRCRNERSRSNERARVHNVLKNTHVKCFRSARPHSLKMLGHTADTLACAHTRRARLSTLTHLARHIRGAKRPSCIQFMIHL